MWFRSIIKITVENQAETKLYFSSENFDDIENFAHDSLGV